MVTTASVSCGMYLSTGDSTDGDTANVEVRTGAALGASSGDALAAGSGNTGDGGDIVLGAGAATEAAAHGGNLDIRADNSDLSTGGRW
jgi:hypothetical protein